MTWQSKKDIRRSLLYALQLGRTIRPIIYSFFFTRGRRGLPLHLEATADGFNGCVGTVVGTTETGITIIVLFGLESLETNVIRGIIDVMLVAGSTVAGVYRVY